MLYVTTRLDRDTYCADRALTETRAPDGGFYTPAHLPRFSSFEISKLGEKPFSRNVADIVNLFFDSKLDGWAVEFAIGRYPVKLAPVSGRATVAETWHNPVWRFERLARGIEKAICQSDQISQTPSDWLMIASRIAVLFGIFGDLIREGTVKTDAPIDVAVPSGNLSACVAACFAREMGLPISTVLVCCNENNGPWTLLHKGELRTDTAVISTDTSDCDQAVPAGLERLIHGALGVEETMKFLTTKDNRGNYYLEPYQTEQLRKGIYVSVVSRGRMESMIKALYNTSGYLADAYTALVYGGLADYRARTGESRHALILSEESPTFSLNVLAKALGMTPAEVKNRIDKG